MSLSIGILGAGGIAHTHAATLHAHDEVEVAAICDIAVEKAQELGESVDADAYSDYTTLFEEVDLDGVYITTPPQTRVEIIEAAAQHGSAVFCEKPLAVSVADGRRIQAIVEEYAIPFMVGFCLRFCEPCQRLHDIVHDGTIGKPRMVFSQRAGWGVPSSDNWRVDPEHACGITIESSSHNIDLIRWLGGEITSASGQTMNSTHPEIETFDDSMVATVSLGEDCIGFIQNTWTSKLKYLRHGVVGTEGAVLVEGDEWWRVDRLTYAVADDSYPTTISFDAGTATDMGYEEETNVFIDCLNTGSPPPVDVHDGLRALEVSHQILG